MIVEDIDYDIGTLNNAGTVDHDYGYDVDGKIGYDFGGFRLETEVGYRSATVDGYSSTTTTPFITRAGGRGNAVGGNYPLAGGKTSALSFMLNGLLDFGDDDGIQGFVGGGVGVARVKANYSLNVRQDFLDDSDTVFAWQGLAGIRAPLTDHLDATLKYRFFNAENVKLVGNLNNLPYEGRFRSHSILGGVTYNFGSPTPPPPPPPPPAPPPPPPPPAEPAPVVTCQPGPFIVFFEWNKSDITPEAASILDNAVTQYQSCGNAQVQLAGYTDTSGTTTYNQGLSQRRADAVKAYMASRSIPDSVITTSAFGETNLRVQTADGVREVQNRRVEITYGQGSGQ
jgi:outer membrane protein OmpA-like peptidoglycan-associated protein